MLPIRIHRALLSVSDKRGLVDFARALAAADVELFASGGTKRHLELAGLAVQEVSDYTGFPEMMDGRLKTLHPKVHGGILCRHDRPDDMAAMRAQGIVPFELVVVNLYPFEETIAKAEVTDDEAIEQIDIGGPTLLRGAAKNHRFATLATSPEQYSAIVEQLQAHGGTTLELRRRLASEAFEIVARYDRAIANYFSREGVVEPLAEQISLNLHRREVLRYGENPHQQAALYALPSSAGANLVSARKLHGKELSYNNLLDLDAALAIARWLPTTAAVVIKHNNPCGAACDGPLDVAMRKALEGDPASAFGGIVGVNRPLDRATAEVLAGPNQFIEAIVAPQFDAAAIEVLTTKPKWRANVRLLEVGALDAPADAWQFRPIEGGFLLQTADATADPEDPWRIVTKTKPSDEQLAELRFAWAIVRHVKSNAIVLSKHRMLVGVGAGQMSRVDSTEIAIRKAGPRTHGAVMASDAFFPFGDSIKLAAAAGIAAVIQPGGSKRDDESIAACDEKGIAMVFTGRRHFKH
ncbi:MAG: bifunctional phosphoribosylaminoimidazolecarboxamide formyltransferase/IMP cyclohydrolase [Pirellulales bacterium]|nr:bifunctional phosphoribosylaminoimidazolecarboxamide formyltransferase/IMP cyclohydrolase [Pirellulales bacterium]